MQSAASTVVAGRASLAPEWVQVNSDRQAVLYQFRLDNAPVLLWFHGGPGSTLMPWTEVFDAPLLEKFSVVHWDQRCAGLSYRPGDCVGTMSMAQMIDDAVAVVRAVRAAQDNESSL
jgi:pimeloyl-ACP methyl ester carboxylesterase